MSVPATTDTVKMKRADSVQRVLALACRVRHRCVREVIVHVQTIIIIMVEAMDSLASRVVISPVSNRAIAHAIFKMTTCSRVAISLVRAATVSLASRVAISPVRAVTVSLASRVAISLVRVVTVSLASREAISPVRVATVSLASRVAISPVRAAIASIAPITIPMPSIR